MCARREVQVEVLSAMRLVAGDAQHALITRQHEAPVAQRGVGADIHVDDESRATFECDDAHAQVLDGQTAFVAVGFALHLADGPGDRRIAQHETDQVDNVGGLIQQAAFLHAHIAGDGSADGAVSDEPARMGKLRDLAAHVANHELDAVLVAGRGHGLDAAHVRRDGLLANDRLGAGLGGGDHHRRVELAGRADAHDVQRLVLQHGLGAGVAARHVEAPAHVVHERGVEIGDGGKLCGGAARVAVRVAGADAKPHDAGTIHCHRPCRSRRPAVMGAE